MSPGSPGEPAAAPAVSRPAGHPGLLAQAAGTLALAVPVMFARAGLVAMTTVDTAMTGRVGPSAIAQYAISLAPHVTLMVIGIGLLSGTTVLTAQAEGAGRRRDCGQIWHMSLLLAGGFGLLIGLILAIGAPLLDLLGQPPSLAEGGGRALQMFATGMPAIMLYVATSFFLEGAGRPRPGMYVAILANLLNAALNWLLIEGNLGAPAMGAAGAALATSLTRWAMLLALAGYVFVMPGARGYGVAEIRVGRRAAMAGLLALGAPFSVATFLEVSAFSALATFAGHLGELPLAGYQVAHNVNTIVFMMAIGLSTATAVKVANAVGRRDPAAIARAGWTGIFLVGALMALVCVAIRLAAPGIAGLYVDDPRIVALAVPSLMMVAWLAVFDGLQGVILGALRGMADVLVPTAVYALAFWGLGLPLAYAWGVAGGGGAPGLLTGMLVGLMAASLLLALRFAVLARRAGGRGRAENQE